MSDPISKAERSRAKDIRQGVIEQRSSGTKNKRERTVLVEHRIHPECKLPSWFRNWYKDWGNWRRYRTVDEATKAIADYMRKHPHKYELRIADQASIRQPSQSTE